MNSRGRPRVLPDEAVRRMHDTLNMSVAQIAQAFGNSRTAVRVSLNRTSNKPPVPAWAFREALREVVDAYDECVEDMSGGSERLHRSLESAIRILEGSGV